MVYDSPMENSKKDVEIMVEIDKVMSTSFLVGGNFNNILHMEY